MTQVDLSFCLKSDKGEGCVGLYGVVGSLEGSGELHTSSDNGEGGVGPYGVIGVGIDNTGDGINEGGRSSAATSERRLPPSSKSQGSLGCLFTPAFNRDHKACMESRARLVCWASTVSASNKTVRIPKSCGDA